MRSPGAAPANVTRRGRLGRNRLSLQGIHQREERRHIPAQTNLIFEGRLRGALTSAIQMGPKPQRPHHRLNLLGQSGNDGAEDHHWISTIAIDSAVSFYEASQAGHAKSWSLAHPRGHFNALTVLSTA